MKFDKLPHEIQARIFEKLRATELIKIWQGNPELRYLITPDTLRIVSNNDELKERYDLPDEFFIIDPLHADLYEDIQDESYNEDSNKSLNLEIFEGFNGAMLIDHRYGGSDYWWRYFELYLLNQTPIEAIYDCDAWTEDTQQSFEHYALRAGKNLKRITLLGLNNIDQIPSTEISPDLLCIPGIKGLTVENFTDYKLDVLSKFIPSLKELIIEGTNPLDPPDLGYYGCSYSSFFHSNPYSYSYGYSSESEPEPEPESEPEPKKPNVFDQFPTLKINNTISFDFLKTMTIRHIHDASFKFEEWCLPNLEVLTVETCTIHSIQQLTLPKLITFEIRESSMCEIANLKLDSLVSFMVDISPIHFKTYSNDNPFEDSHSDVSHSEDLVYEDMDCEDMYFDDSHQWDHAKAEDDSEEKKFCFGLRNIDAENLENLSLHSGYKIKKISNLRVPSLKIATFQEAFSPTDFEDEEEMNDYLKTIPDYSQMQLELDGDPFGSCQNIKTLEIVNLATILQNTQILANLETLNIASKAQENNIQPQVHLKTLLPKLKNLTLIKQLLDEEPFFIKLPNLENLKIYQCPGFKIDLVALYNKKIKSLHINQLLYFKDIKFLEFPSLETLKLVLNEYEFAIRNCSFNSLKSLKICKLYKTYRSSSGTLEGGLKFVENEAPNLENLIMTHIFISSPLSTKPYPKLKNLVVDDIGSLQISSSETLETIDLSKNSSIQNLEISDDLPNLKVYKKAQNPEPERLKREINPYAYTSLSFSPKRRREG